MSYTHEELAGELEATAAELLWELEIEAPPVDAFEVARRLGLRVARDRAMRSRGRLARVTAAREVCGGGLIVLAEEPRPERRQWAVAHEVGEYVAHRVLERLGASPMDLTIDLREQIANGFACRLLLPRRWLRLDAEDFDWDFAAIKSAYPTASYELIARRVLELMPAPVVVTVLDHGDVTWRRANFRATAPEVSENEWQVAMQTHHRGQTAEAASMDGAVRRVRCWPVHEPDWRREVMLTELNDAW